MPRGRIHAEAGEAALLAVGGRFEDDPILQLINLLPCFGDTLQLALLLLHSLVTNLCQLLLVAELHGLFAYPESRQLDLVINEWKSRGAKVPRPRTVSVLAVTGALDDLIHLACLPACDFLDRF